MPSVPLGPLDPKNGPFHNEAGGRNELLPSLPAPSWAVIWPAVRGSRNKRDFQGRMDKK